MKRIPDEIPTVETEDHAQLLYTIVRNVRHAEEPDAGNPPVRFCEGH
jgi:hypothetical protein